MEENERFDKGTDLLFSAAAPQAGPAGDFETFYHRGWGLRKEKSCA